MCLISVSTWVPHRLPSACSMACTVDTRSSLRRLSVIARAHGCKAVVVTFDPDPDVVVSPSPAQKLMTTADRLHALAQTGSMRWWPFPLRLRLRRLTMLLFSRWCRVWSTFDRFALAATLGWVVAVLLV